MIRDGTRSKRGTDWEHGVEMMYGQDKNLPWEVLWQVLANHRRSMKCIVFVRSHALLR